jgi:biopolymer transport protein ExbB/TolQ
MDNKEKRALQWEFIKGVAYALSAVIIGAFVAIIILIIFSTVRMREKVTILEERLATLEIQDIIFNDEGERH